MKNLSILVKCSSEAMKNSSREVALHHITSVELNLMNAFSIFNNLFSVDASSSLLLIRLELISAIHYVLYLGKQSEAKRKPCI